MITSKYRSYTGYEPLPIERIDDLLRRGEGEGLEQLEDKRWPIVYAKYQFERLPVVHNATEFGGASEIFSVWIKEGDFDVERGPIEEDISPLNSLLKLQSNYNNELGNLCAYIQADKHITVVDITYADHPETSSAKDISFYLINEKNEITLQNI